KLARLRIEAGKNSERRDEVDFAARDDGRGNLGDLLVVFPSDVRVGDVAAAVHANGHELRLHIAGADVGKAIAIDGARDQRVAIAEVDAPQLAAGRRLITDSPLSAGNDRLLPPTVLDHQRRAERSAMDGVGVVNLRARRLPNTLAPLHIESQNKLLIRGVARQDYHATLNERRAARPGDFVEQE